MTSFFDCTVGQESLPTGRAALTVRLFGHELAGKRVNQWPKVDKFTPCSAINSTRTAAMPGARPDVARSMGFWDTFRHEVEDGLTMVLHGTLQAKLGPAGMRTQYLGLTIRETGPLYMIRMPTTRWSKGALTEVTVSGRFDLLTYEECLERGFCGVEDVLAHWKTDRPASQRLFEIREVAPETAPRPRRITDEVRNSDGQTVRVAVRESRRGLVLD